MNFNKFFSNRQQNLSKILSRYVSTSLDLWESEISSAIKFQIEKSWKDKINVHKFNHNETKKEKFYILAMFPYPSGSLHMGHVRVYSISDSLARFYSMTGKNVFHPMGWDAFGLPAENAAIERNKEPSAWTMENIKKMREQLDKLACSFDWDNELNTSSPEYYKWTQELFLKLFDQGLVYRKEEFVNWDPVDETVLAKEQVDENNRSWRSGALVEEKLLNQWFIRTTAFAKSLLDGLTDPSLREWKDVIKMQNNWIGDCNGISFEFQLESDIRNYPKTMNLWTEHPEFIEYAQFVVISPDNVLNRPEYIRRVNENIQEMNAKVINPFTGKKIPVFVSEYNFPTGRKIHLGIPSASMVDMEFGEIVGIPFERHRIRSHEDQQNKLTDISNKAKELKIGGYPTSSKLYDWLISRQRYWGTPIPIIHCPSCGARPVPRDQLPVLLPPLNGSVSKNNALLHAKEWLETTCPDCKGPARREADTMDTFVDSSWYFLRFIDSKNSEEMFSIDKARKMLPVDLYIGGKEHGLLHLYFARFVNHFLHSLGLVENREPFTQLLTQGMVRGKSYKIAATGEYLEPDKVEISSDNKYVEKETGKKIIVAWEKMSKSKYNGVDPEELLSTYGIDTTRLLILANVAPTSHRNWSTDTIPGILNWQQRLWLTIRQLRRSRTNWKIQDLEQIPTDEELIQDDKSLFESRNRYIKSASWNLKKSQQLSVAISRLQELTNDLRRVSLKCLTHSREYERALGALIIMISPMAPHFASELWSGFCTVPYHLSGDEFDLSRDVVYQKWPEIDMEYELSLVVYNNHDRVARLKITRRELKHLTDDAALELATSDPKVQEIFKNLSITRTKFLSGDSYDAFLYINTVLKDKMNSIN